jgi:hypothetical protein
MWVSGEEKTEDISYCFTVFPQFNKDFGVLNEKGVIKRIAFNHYKWTKSETSLAEYFKWIAGNEPYYVPGGFWGPIAETFRIDRRKLSKRASNNANPLKPEKSKDFLKIKKMVENYRSELKERLRFNLIKNLIIETDDHDIKKIRAALQKTKSLLPFRYVNCGKKI